MLNFVRVILVIQNRPCYDIDQQGGAGGKGGQVGQLDLRFSLAILVSASFLVFDLSIPLGVAAGVPYVAVVLLGAWSRMRHGILMLAVVSSLFTTLGFVLSPPGGLAWMVLTNRGLALFAIWVTAILLLQRRNAEQALQQAHNGLERRVAEVTVQVREREARLRGVLENVADGIITIDGQGVIDGFSRSAELLFGHMAEQVMGRNVSMLMPEPHDREHDSYIQSYLHTSEGRIIGIAPREVVALRADGSRFPMEISVSEADFNGKCMFIAVVRDLSQRKETEKQLRQAQKMEAIGHLTGGVAHDFNNLLTAIQGNLELMAEYVVSGSEARRLLDAALGATLRGADLTQRLLAFSRKQTLRPEALDVNRLVSGMNELFAHTIGEDIQIELVLAGGLWRAVVDPSQLENALLNLAINARDAMPAGGKLTLETANTRLDDAYADAHDEVRPGQYVMVAVTDTGTGIQPEVLEHAFEPFYTTKEVGKGSGLGLSMVYGFVKQSAGHVKIYSEVGEGTTVKLYLPRATGPDRELAAAEPRAAAQSIGDETILVVEDDADVRAFVTAALGILGYRVLKAEDGPAALALLEQVPHLDLLLTDVVLPGGVNGRQVADLARRRFPALKVLYTSGYTDNAVVHHGILDAGAEMLAKPYTREILARKVRGVLDG